MILRPLEERRALADDAIREHPDWSDRRLSKSSGICRETIAHRRALLADREGLVTPEATRGRDDKVYLTRRRPRYSYALLSRITLVRRIARDIDDGCWDAATPEMRRLLWQSAEQLADKIGQRIGSLGMLA